MKGFGSKWYDGRIIQKYSEETFGSLIAAAGSAPSIDPEEFFKMYAGVLSTLGLNFLKGTGCEWCICCCGQANRFRLFKPKFFNMGYGYDKCTGKYLKKITAIDQGIKCNVPLSTFRRKEIAIHVICESSAGIGGEVGSQMIKAAKYAKKHNYPFPNIDITTIEREAKDPKKPICIWSDGKKLIIYIKNPSQVSTFQFDYTKEAFNKAVNDVTNLVLNNADEIKKAIQDDKFAQS